MPLRPLASLLVLTPALAGNPLRVNDHDFYGADPSAIVAEDGRLFLFPTTDNVDWEKQFGWSCYSTTDLVQWTDHGVIFSNEDSAWGTHKAWAPDITRKDGRYYFYYYFNQGKPTGGVGVAVADRPEGPYREVLDRVLVRGHDPAVFADDDGRYWLYLQDRVYELGDDMASFRSGPIDLELAYRPDKFEAAYVFKREGRYYFTVARDWNNLIYYMGDSPTGPFTYQGEFFGTYGGNNHHSIVEYKGRWVLFHHEWVKDDPAHQRRLRAEFLHFNDDGTLRMVEPTDEGVGDTFVNLTHVDDLCVHDPCVLADRDTRTYYVYRGFSPSRFGDTSTAPGRAGVQAFWSTDLVHWSGPTNVFEIPDGFWADADANPWAPEVHRYRDRYYLFTTFNAWQEQLDERPGRPFINRRASQVLVADSPLGPFRPFANRPHTPPGEMTLDATLWVEDGQPWLVYCHEWVQLGDGLVKAIRLADDLSETVGEPVVLLSAADVPWTRKDINYRGETYAGAVTDGPFLYRTDGGRLLLFWSSWTPDRQYAQAVAVSASDRVTGPWRHDPAQPILWDDRGHGMVFRDFDDRLLLCLHRYFHPPQTRVQFWTLQDTGDGVRVMEQVLGAP